MEMKFDEEVFVNLLNTFPGHVFWMDMSGVILGVNDAQVKDLGFTHKKELIGKNVKEVCTPEAAAEILKNNQDVFTSQRTVTFEEYNNSFGEKYYQVYKMPLKSGDTITGVLGISLDITDKKRREELEIKTKAQERANNTLRFWASAIAHELRSPLLSLAMTADGLGYILNKLQADHPELFENPLIKKRMNQIKPVPDMFARVIKDANNFIDMTLMKSKYGEEKGEMKLEKVSIKAMLENSLDTYPFRENGRNLVHVDIQDNFEFMGEENYFRHIIYNLTKNAIYFIKKARKGEIFITAKAEKDKNVLIFKDTSFGMSKEVLENLFQPFYTRSQNGTGVGLSLCKNIMEGFGGSISCEAVEGEFSAFSLWFRRVA